ncbi:hypothetical protein JAAARDRAFT_201934 [Jaapia argillacea MUCL 33604]|uniref:Ankyrin n=1 Tax=Jaapia argillacea MUCL 33604 TaxID=933084 RepID=A0A067QC27_9AGAM|nr:hypothetical protein JAAARDRAFT_201934 [Jaapia argillacea MUCL 33604]
MAEKDATARLRRAVKENNLFLVKRLIQRTDMRNPDSAPRRFTSLAWAAILGHEETFEFLLSAGHDDEELSKDSDNNTILILLADLKPPASSPYSSLPPNPDFMAAALRMGRLYYDRYPFTLDWANSQGKTALHVASLRGNEELVRMLCDLGADYDLSDNQGNTPLHYASAWGHVPIVQLLIERGCQYSARNNEGFTASDYAYSFSTRDTLQDTARLQFENNKKARRQVFAQAAARGNEWGGAPPTAAAAASVTSASSHPSSLFPRALNFFSGARMRSGSGGSRTTATSDSGDYDANNLVPGHPMTSQSSLSTTSSPSQPSANSSSGSFFHVPPTSATLIGSSTSSSTATFSTNSPAQSTSTVRNANNSSTLSPIVHRMRERDADAMEKYMRRTRGRSGSEDMPEGPSFYGNGTPLSTITQGVADRRLRPSASAAQLRSPTLPPPVITTTQEPPRTRSGTTPTPLRPAPISVPSQPAEDSAANATPRPSMSREGSLKGRQKDEQDYTGPPSDYAHFPPPPESKPPSTSTVVPSASSSMASSAISTVTRRLPFNLLSKPLPSIDSSLSAGGHRRGNSQASLRS